ncbi:MAG: hypothetical protein J7L12_04340 [Desulfurococcales archaeon]|nr:hypothetical protein [Desulfurococcales archaeon]
MIVKIPLHVSGFWVPIIKKDYILSGSLGAGIMLSPYCVIREASKKTSAGSSVLSRGANIVSAVANYLGLKPEINIELLANVGLGEGFGLSAALALGYAIHLLKKKQGTVSLVEAGKAAHFAEVFNMTGLGDVIAEVLGRGLTVRVRPGPPGIGEVDCVLINERVKVTTVHLGRRLFTPQMLRQYYSKIVEAGWAAYSGFLKDYSIYSFLSKAYEFSRAVGFLDPKLDEELRNQLKNYVSNGSVLGYFVKKSLLVIIHSPSCSEELKSTLSNYGVVRVFEPASSSLTIEYQ